MINTLINNRYHIHNELGRGGMGIVYRAVDTLLQRDVAVKVLWTNSLGSQGRARLLREAQAAARLNHPNIINIYDAGDSDGLSYIVMELLDGESLFDHHPGSLEENLDIFRQICDALGHAHLHGIIHRDLKPENVIVTSQGIAKLTDFGLSRSATSRVSQEGIIVGTVYYLAPEQALRQDIDHRADLYALGVLMYELVTGRLPFTADDPLGVISQHLHAPVVPPSTYRPDITPGLENIILRLLNKHPEDRPSSAAEVRYVLDHLSDHEELSRTAVNDLSPLDRLTRGRMVGRQEEIDRVKVFWRDILSGSSRMNTLVISAESGIGKTPFLKEVRSLAQVTGARAFLGECFSSGNSPYAPIAQILRQASPLPEGIPDSILADLVSISPELITRPVPVNPILSPLSEQQRLFDSICRVITILADRQPLVISIEDAHWSDRNSLYFLRHLARYSRSNQLKLMLVITYRPDGLADNQALQDVLLDLRQERLSSLIELLPYTREKTRQLLQVMFMEEISDPFLDAIYKVTEGNLFFIEEICKALIEEGRLFCDGGHWHLTEITDLELPQSIRTALQMRIQRLSPVTQELLRHAAIIGREFDFRVLRLAVDSKDEEALIEAMEQAERAQLISEVRNQCCTEVAPNSELFAFAHTLIPATLREDISNLRRRRMHRLVAAAIETVSPDDLDALAYHYSQAGDHEKMRIYLTRAGDRARKLYANHEALKFYTEALQLVPVNHPDRFKILQSRARVFELLAQREPQRQDIDAMLELAETLDDDQMRCDGLIALSDLFLLTDSLLAKEPARRAVTIAQKLNDPVREARALRCVGWGAWTRNDFHESLSALENAVTRFRQANQDGLAAECLHTLSLVTGMQGLGEKDISKKYAEDAIALSRSANDRRQEAISTRRLAIVYLDDNDFPRSLETAQLALRMHREMGDRNEECMALNNLGVILGWMGRLEECQEHLLRTYEIALSIHSVIGIWLAFANLIWFVYRRDGKYEDGLNYTNLQLENPLIIENPFLSMNFENIKATLLLNLGKYQEALDALEEMRKTAYHFAGPLVQAELNLSIAVNRAELHDFDGARAALNEAKEMAKKLERSNDAANILVTEANISRREWEAGKLTQLRRASQLINQAISLLRGTHWVVDLAYALNIAAWITLSENQPQKALEYTREAIQIYASQPVKPEGYQYVHVCALWANGLDEEAAGFLDQAYERVMLVANKIKSPELRASWLESVDLNRQIIRDWALYHT